MTDAWPVVAAALGSSSLTIVGTFWLERWRSQHALREAQHDRLRAACVQMGSHALAYALRANMLYVTIIDRSGIGEGLDIALYHRKPLDAMDLWEWLSVDLIPMLEAQILIEVTANEDVVRAASDLILASTEVLEKATSISPRAGLQGPSKQFRVGGWLRGLVSLRRNPDVEKEIEQAVRQLARQLRRFTRVTREHLGVNDPDVVIRAFPGLFREDDSSEKDRPLSQGASE